jgi:Histidine kinase-, DNA gyrase B-, and HSP90-like ATPase
MHVLALKAKHDHLEKVASTREPVKALAEFVWNALDADATWVSVDFMGNALDGLEGVVIRDNGTGISKVRAEHDFESLGSPGSCTRTGPWAPSRHTLKGRKRALSVFLARTKGEMDVHL